MWLLNTSTFKLHGFLDHCNVPSYAILSHTWSDEEVTFQNIQNPTSEVERLAGYQKVKECCNQAVSDGFQYVWIDTCCIDRSNSTELSEAINSMFSWYRCATECYAYLADVQSVLDFTTSRWFTRSWTLQELIAPPSVIFYNAMWEEIGTKASLKERLSSFTGIPRNVLLWIHPQTQENQGMDIGNDMVPSIAQIMSWAAEREATREEDIAYSLLGLFGVNMPMIYGEGKRAFTRLQEEIIKISDDQSIFAWIGSGHERGPLAQSPAEFSRSGHIKRCSSNQATEYVMTNKGLRITLLLAPDHSKSGVHVAFLNLGLGNPVGIYLKIKANGVTVRTSCDQIVEHADGFSPIKATDLYIARPSLAVLNPVPSEIPSKATICQVRVTYHNAIGSKKFFLLKTLPAGLNTWDTSGEQIVLSVHACGTKRVVGGGVMFQYEQSKKRFAVVLGFEDAIAWAAIDTQIGKTMLDFSRRKIYVKRAQASGPYPNRIRRTFADASIQVTVRSIFLDGIKQYAVHVFGDIER
jgi:hypothetical protein